MMLAAVVPSGLDDADRDVLTGLLNKLDQKNRRNTLRQRYYDGKVWLRSLGISIPPSMAHIETVVGWPAKSVDSLAHRIVFEGLVAPGHDDDPFGLSEVLLANRVTSEFPMATTSALIHSVAFVSVLNGDTAAGEPDVVWQFHSALHTTGNWDRRRRALSAGLLVTDADPNGQPTGLVLMFPDRVGVLDKQGKDWRAVWRANPLGVVPLEPLPFRPDLDRPFGRSRISRPVMSMTDEAIRTVVRTEVSAEFFAAPQRYALGADEDAFEDADGKPIPAWQSILGRLWTISRDDEGNVPTVGQFPQQSMSPHTEHLRTIAARFASETSLPLSSLGIVHENPSSAEAIHAAKEDLVIEAQDASRVFSTGLVAAAAHSIRLRDGVDAVTADVLGLQAKWTNPATPSVVSASDAILKQVSAVPWLAESPVILEQLGYDQATITRLLADRRRAQGAGLIERLANLNATDLEDR